jgi:hypothetical protein
MTSDMRLGIFVGWTGCKVGALVREWNTNEAVAVVMVAPLLWLFLTVVMRTAPRGRAA